MKPIYAQFCSALALTFTIAACVPAPAPPPAVATPAPAPPPSPTPAATPAVQQVAYANFLDAPQTPGDWSYVDEPGESLALFGVADPVHPFVLRCDKGSRRIGIARRGETTRPLVMRIRTETRDGVLSATQVDGWRLVAANVAASDPLLDAMAISKGRIAVEVEGMPTLYIPAWPEITRVIEDCR